MKPTTPWYQSLPLLLLSGTSFGLCFTRWTMAQGRVEPSLLRYSDHWWLGRAGVRLTDEGEPWVRIALHTDPGMLCLVASAVTVGIAVLESSRALCWLPRRMVTWLSVPSALLAAGAVAYMMSEPRGSVARLEIDRTELFYGAVVATAAAAIFALTRALGIWSRRRPQPDAQPEL